MGISFREAAISIILAKTPALIYVCLIMSSLTGHPSLRQNSDQAGLSRPVPSPPRWCENLYLSPITGPNVGSTKLVKSGTIPETQPWKVQLQCHTLASRASLPIMLSSRVCVCVFLFLNKLIHFSSSSLLRWCVVHRQARCESMTGAHASR